MVMLSTVCVCMLCVRARARVRAYKNFELGIIKIESYHELNSYKLVFPET